MDLIFKKMCGRTKEKHEKLARIVSHLGFKPSQNINNIILQYKC
jgi:hypothetical protein